jgi:hypothetical protein
VTFIPFQILLVGKIARADNKEKETLQAALNTTKEKLLSLKLKLQERNIEFENEIKRFDATVVSKNQTV